MKHISLIINGILAIVVAILFYQVNSLKNTSSSTESDSKEEKGVKQPPIVLSSATLADAKIAYVNTDSINEHYAYIADFTKIIRAKKATLESQLENMTADFQKEYEAFQQSAQAGIAPQSEMMKQEESLKRKQKEIANKELQMQNLGVELDEKNLELNKNVKEFLKVFNNGKFDYILSYSDLVPSILLANPKLDVTSEVIKGLNAEYNSKKQKK